MQNILIDPKRMDILSERLRDLADECRSSDYTLATLLDRAYQRAYELAAREYERLDAGGRQPPSFAGRPMEDHGRSL